MTVVNRGAFAVALAAGAIVLANCSGGGGGGGTPGGPVPTTNPTTPPTQAPSSSTATAPLPAAGLPYQLPSLSGAGGTIIYSSYTASKKVVNVTYTTSLHGQGAPTPPRYGQGTPAIVFTEQISADANVAFSAVPSFALILPTGYSNAGPFSLFVFDQTTNQLVDGENASSVSGNTVNFPYIHNAYGFVTGHLYTFELVTNNQVPSPSPSPTIKPSPSPSPSVSPSPSASPSQSPSPSPSPTSTPSCGAPPPDPHVASVPLTGFVQAIGMPCFQSFRSNLTLPKNNGGGSSPLEVRLESSTDKSLNAPSPSPGTGTPIFYESIKPSGQLIPGGTLITANISSERDIVPTHTYALNVFENGVMLVPTVTGLVPSGHNLSIPINLSPGTVFAGQKPAQFVLYQSP